MSGLASGRAVRGEASLSPALQSAGSAIGPARCGIRPGNRGGKGPLDFSAGNDETSYRKNLDVGEALRGYVQERVVHTVEKSLGREPAADVRIEKHGERAALGGTFRSCRRSCEGLAKMHLSDFISSDSVIPSLRAKTKKQLLQELAARAARRTALPERVIFDVLLQRERLGSTGLGQGIAIPHGKIPGLKGIVGIFARLAEPIDFEAVDGEPVDIVFLLLAPEGAGADHLKALARISRLLREGSAVEKLRGSRDAAALYAVLTEGETSSHAA